LCDFLNRVLGHLDLFSRNPQTIEIYKLPKNFWQYRYSTTFRLTGVTSKKQSRRILRRIAKMLKPPKGYIHAPNQSESFFKEEIIPSIESFYIKKPENIQKIKELYFAVIDNDLRGLKITKDDLIRMRFLLIPFIKTVEGTAFTDKDMKIIDESLRSLPLLIEKVNRDNLNEPANSPTPNLDRLSEHHNPNSDTQPVQSSKPDTQPVQSSKPDTQPVSSPRKARRRRYVQSSKPDTQPVQPSKPDTQPVQPSKPDTQPANSPPSLDELTERIKEPVKQYHQKYKSSEKIKGKFRLSDDETFCFSTSTSYYVAKALSDENALQTLSKKQFEALVKRLDRILNPDPKKRKH
ncbi:MAG: hypothetical protein SNJ66_11170, partial [Chloroherpetonaceae bacterium]